MKEETFIAGTLHKTIVSYVPNQYVIFVRELINDFLFQFIDALCFTPWYV